ncbi:MAG TPA: PadR family transcriptional regulator [Thermoplasmata archaeon]|nr:PadR family transcriptional regulator [Thermoplasmata archaeon]
MQSGPLVRPTLPFLIKGGFRALVLRALSERPMHGYEVIKVLEERFQGFYRPSAGAVYPALRSLQREGLIAVRGSERRKTYHITARGKAHIHDQREAMQRHFASFQAAVGPERASLLREVRDTGRLLMRNLRTITPRQAEELKQAVTEMRGRFAAILAETGEV